MMTLHGIGAVAKFEMDLLTELAPAGLTCASSQGKQLGRPASLSKQSAALVKQKLGEGAAAAALTWEYGTSRQSLMRLREAEVPDLPPEKRIPC